MYIESGIISLNPFEIRGGLKPKKGYDIENGWVVLIPLKSGVA